MTDLFGRHKKALVIGAGSGRDMATAVIITEKLRTKGIRVDLAGFLTPWSVHTFEGQLEQPINVLTRDSKKFLAIDLKKPLSTYFEPKLLDLNKKLDLGINKFFLFSLQYGTSKLRNAIQNLVDKERYDLIMAVDVGGDCLAMKYHTSIFTPLVDLSCINILSKIRFDGNIILSVIAPGSDGEIKTSRIKKIISILRKKALILDEEKISYQNQNIGKFLKLNRLINYRTYSTSGTFRIIEKYLQPKSPVQHKELYVKQFFINGKNFYFRFSQIIEKRLIRSILYLDLKNFFNSNRTKMNFSTILDAQKKYRRSFDGTEVDFSYIPIIKGAKILEVIYSITPMKRIKGNLRKKMIAEGEKLVKDKNIKSLMI